jgi:hypothetical protein
MKAFYATRIPSMPKSSDDIDSGDDVNDIIEATNFKFDMEDREEKILSKSVETAKKIQEIEEKFKSNV